MLKPKIRFRGFEEKWSNKKVKEFGNIITGYTPSRNNHDLWKGNLNWISAQDLNKKYVIDTIEHINHDSANKTRILPKDSLIVTCIASIGLNALLKKEAVTNQQINGIICDKEFDKEFLYYLFVKNKESLLQSASKTAVPIISKSDFEEINYYVAKNNEQKLIGDLFANTDILIASSNKKIEKWKNIRASFISKMFPKHGRRVPELRFKGFSGEWQEYKLGEYVEFRRGSFPQPYGKKEWYDGYGAMPFVQVIDVADNMKLVDDTKQKISLQAQPMSVLAKKDQVVVTLQGSIGRVAVLQYDAYIDRTLLIFEKYNYDTNIDFFAYIIKNKFDEEAKKAPGGIIKTITKEALSSFDILMPNIEEQKAIARFLYNLDKNIECQQQKVTKLKQIKEAFLSKMFV